jgi:hypothetical protein
MSLPERVIREDNRLEKITIESQEALAKLRWHWTLDESNDKRVSVNSYANSVGISHSKIRAMVVGYTNWTDVGPNTRSLSDFIELAKMGSDRAAATEALADARKTTVTNIAAHNRNEIREVVNAAQEAASRRGTSVNEEIPRMAQVFEKQRTQRKTAAEQRKADHDALYSKLELRISTARRALNEVLTEARNADFDDDIIGMLSSSISSLKAVIGLIDMAIVGEVDVNWDEELEKLA